MQRELIKHLINRIAKPSLKAFIYAYLYIVLPRIFGQLISAIKRKRLILSRFTKPIIRAFHPRKFPMFSACLVALINILEPIIFGALKRHGLTKRTKTNLFVSTLISSLISAMITFPIYQNHVLGYGRYNSLDLTLLVATRAIDTTFSSTLAKIAPSSVTPYGDAGLFIASCFFIMYNWFYHPEKLPPSYQQWITSAANMDDELRQILRLVKTKEIVYGEHGPMEDFLVPYFEKYGQDPKGASTYSNTPISCESVHAFKTKSCELHALWRFYRGFKFAFTVYAPLNLLMLVFPSKLKRSTRIIRALRMAIRSSCFLGAFIGFYWYAVCLARTRLFPKLFPKIPRTKFDDTIGPSFGALMCGLSSFIETPHRRKELALFVAPRALGTLVNLEPTKENLKIESIAFSIGLAILVAFSKNSPTTVRGIFGKGLKQVFNIDYYV
ncbi:uncharacterized protein J8A68_004137 [[Candida] subhashii]|uniref:Transmembrane protein 135 N-terminal domain-containing protein n=1 Tax=[Candida] subhashii TaxID=561895 RepID=A0A8J5QJT9_9ASCO|nr:uncharacterized protein J8A68_004137 [[Candida] subhashii]KAG7662366.1 hypothetical protein J8A68_004137 [[Candida] subhashii]